MGYRIAHVGAFDFENFGDLLFTDVLKKQLERRLNIKEIIYFAPKTCKMPNKEEQVYSLTMLEKMADERKFDAIIVGGGDLVHLRMIQTYMPHISESWVIYEVLYMWVIPSLVARRYGIPLFWNAPGVPLHFGDYDKNIVSFLCEAVDYISVRDNEAKKELELVIGSDRIHVVPDTVLSIRNIIQPEMLKKQFVNLNLKVKQKKYIFFQFNISTTEDEFGEYINALQEIKKETGWDVLLQPIGYACGDEEVMRRFAGFYGEVCFLPERHYNQYEILAMIANAAYYIGTSLHGCIVANSYGIPNIVVNSSHFNKIDGFVEQIGSESVRVYRASEIFPAYKANEEKKADDKVILNCLDKIENHFDRLAEGIKTCTKEKKSLSKEIADYIFHSSVAIEQLEKEKISTQNIRNQEREQLQKEMDFYKTLFDEVIHSTSWKITEPLRNLSHRIKNRK